jgi:hypothetical protein
MCGGYLGDMEKGKLKHCSVLLCEGCWRRAEAAVRMAEMARDNVPDVVKDLFGRFGNKEPR